MIAKDDANAPDVPRVSCVADRIEQGVSASDRIVFLAHEIVPVHAARRIC